METNAVTGAVTQRTVHYTELGSSLNFAAPDGSLQRSVDAVQLTPATGGAAALQGETKVLFPPTLADPLVITTPMLETITIAPLAIYYYDTASKKSVLLGAVRSQAQGELEPPNVIRYGSAITDGIRCSIRCVYTHSAFSSDIVFESQPEQPPEAFGLNPATTRIQLVQIITGPGPRQTVHVLKPDTGLSDATLDYGGLVSPVGRGVALPDEDQPPSAGAPAPVPVGTGANGQVLVGKQLVQLPDGRSGLIEEADWLDLKPKLDALPPFTQGASLSVPPHQASLEREPPVLAAKSSGPAPSIRLASNRSAPKGYVLDPTYITIDTDQTHYHFFSGETYLIEGYIILHGVVIFDAGCYIKFDTNAKLTIYDDPPGCGGTLENPTVLTSKDDDLYGAQIDGSTGSPSYTASTALSLVYLQTGTTVSGFKIRWAHTAVSGSGWGTCSDHVYTLADTTVENCGTGLNGAASTLNVQNSTYCNVTTPMFRACGTGSLTHWCEQKVANVSDMQYQEAEPAIAVSPALNSRGCHDMYIFSCGPSSYTSWQVPSSLMMAVSHDGGETWSSTHFADGAYPAGLPMADGSDPCAVYDSHGNLFLSYMTGLDTQGDPGPWRVAVVELAAGASSWNELDQNNMFATIGDGTDQPWLAVGPAPSGQGETLWLCYNDTKDSQFTVRVSGAFIDGTGAVGPFASPQTLSWDNRHPRIAIGPAGQVVCVFQESYGHPWSGSIYYSLNATGLRNGFNDPAVDPTDFAAPAVLATLQTVLWGTHSVENHYGYNFDAAPNRGVCNQPEIAWDRARNGLYVAYTDLPSGNSMDNTDVYVAHADYATVADSGLWQVSNQGGPVEQGDNGATQFLQAIAVDQGSGNVAVGWYDGRAGVPTDYYVLQYYAAISTDGGATFGQNFPLTSGISDAHILSYPSNPYPDDFDDYTALAYVDGVLYAAWADNADSPVPNYSDGTSYLDIYMGSGTPPSP